MLAGRGVDGEIGPGGVKARSNRGQSENSEATRHGSGFGRNGGEKGGIRGGMLDGGNLANFASYKELLRLWLLVWIYDGIPHMQEVAGSSPVATTIRLALR